MDNIWFNKISKFFFLLLACSGLFPSQLFAFFFKDFKVLGGKEQIRIYSEALEIRDDSSNASFKGKVLLIQGSGIINADEMVVFYNNEDLSSGKKISRINMKNNIFIKYGEMRVKADIGFFDFQKQTLSLQGTKGNQVIVRERLNMFLGCKFITNLDTGDSNLEGCDGSKVYAIIDGDKKYGDKKS